MSDLIRRVLAKPRLILDEMCRLYGKFASYLRRVLCKTRLIFPRINGPNVPHNRPFLPQNASIWKFRMISLYFSHLFQSPDMLITFLGLSFLTLSTNHKDLLFVFRHQKAYSQYWRSYMFQKGHIFLLPCLYHRLVDFNCQMIL